MALDVEDPPLMKISKTYCSFHALALLATAGPHDNVGFIQCVFSSGRYSQSVTMVLQLNGAVLNGHGRWSDVAFGIRWYLWQEDTYQLAIWSAEMWCVDKGFTQRGSESREMSKTEENIFKHTTQFSACNC